MEFEDLVGEGYVGLVQASRNFDPERGIKFSTFASTRIHGAMLDALRRENPLSRATTAHVQNYKRTVGVLTGELSREPSDSEVAERMNVSASQLRETRKVASLRLVSISEREESMGEQYESDEEPIADRVMEKMLARELRILVPRLAPREREIITRTFWERHSLSSIGSDMGISESRVSQIRSRALGQLRRMLDGDNALAAA
jgi:RNA polymerase sigma factor for flagellar operon FliA